MSNADKGTAEVVADLVERLDVTEEYSITEPERAGAPIPDVLVVSKGRVVVDLRALQDARLANPRRRIGTSTHTTLTSFLEHVERSRDSQSAIFAVDDMSAPSFLAIYDYNEEAIVVDYSSAPTDEPLPRRPGLPRFSDHRAHYAMPFSDEWQAWTKIAGPSAPWLEQLDFAQALEDRGLDVLGVTDIPATTADACAKLSITPAGPVALMQLSRGLIVRADRKVGSAVNLNSGEAKISFEETHATSVNDAPVVVPTGFVLSIPVFRDGEVYAGIVRLRYRVEGAKVKWKLAMVRPDLVFRDAFFGVTKDVRTKTGLPLFFGRPEK